MHWVTTWTHYSNSEETDLSQVTHCSSSKFSALGIYLVLHLRWQVIPQGLPLCTGIMTQPCCFSAHQISSRSASMMEASSADPLSLPLLRGKILWRAVTTQSPSPFMSSDNISPFYYSYRPRLPRRFYDCGNGRLTPENLGSIPQCFI